MNIKFVILSFIITLSSLAALNRANADVISITGGSLSITYDGSAFADVNNSYMGLSASDGDFMRFGRNWAPNETVVGPTFTPRAVNGYRPLPITNGSGNPRQPNFRDNPELDGLYPLTSPTQVLGVNTSGTVDNSAGSNRQSTTLSFDLANPLATMSGLVQTNGVSAWWFANTALMDQGVAYMSWGELSLRFDPTRQGLGYSGWVFANQLGGKGDIFDTLITNASFSNTGIILQGRLFGSDGSSADAENENFGTWPTYTLMNSDVEIGSFSFSGVTAVPEPGSLILLGLTTATIAGTRWRRRIRQTSSDIS